MHVPGTFQNKIIPNNLELANKATTTPSTKKKWLKMEKILDTDLLALYKEMNHIWFFLISPPPL